MLGRTDEADEEMARTYQLWQEVADPGLEVGAYLFRGEADRYLGRSERAELSFRTGSEGFTALGETGFNSTMTASRALALCDLGRFDEAEAAIEQSRELSSEDDFATQSAWRVARARVLADRGDHERSIAIIDEAIAINDPTDYLAWQGEGLETRGEILVAAGHPEEAKTAFADALDRYERKGVVTWAAHVRSRLDDLRT
jgi:tetratricopeptide (TPR) repeat protein